MATAAAKIAWPRWRLRYLLNKSRTTEEIERLKRAADVNFVPMEAVGENGGLDLSTVRTQEDIGSGYTLFFEDDVLVAKITPCFENGKGAIAKGLVNGVGYGTTELYVLNSEPNIEPRFLFYLTISQAFREPDFVLYLPPLDVQHLIAEHLDRETTRIDALVAEKEKMLALLEEKRIVLISHTVTRGLNPDVLLKASGLDWLGDIPEHWKVE